MVRVPGCEMEGRVWRKGRHGTVLVFSGSAIPQ